MNKKKRLNLHSSGIHIASAFYYDHILVAFPVRLPVRSPVRVRVRVSDSYNPLRSAGEAYRYIIIARQIDLVKMACEYDVCQRKDRA